jgi:catechol 2,3-dioxygenase-like lactoylglutathione lyase family enzyme
MLTNSRIVAFIPTKDAARARRFYEGLGLRFVSDDPFAIVMDANLGLTWAPVPAADLAPRL